jgi:hypothetical protein
VSVRRALDELRFGADRTLNLRDTLPSAADATRRCDGWLRSQQIRGAAEVLVITGRGLHSRDGIAVIRPAIEKLLHSLRRQGVVADHSEHNPGAFTVRLAPLRALTEAPRRRREAPRRIPGFDFAGLDADTLTLLRELADRSLHSLGVRADDARRQDEMHRQIATIAAGLRDAEGDRDERLRAALRRAIAEYD